MDRGVQSAFFTNECVYVGIQTCCKRAAVLDIEPDDRVVHIENHIIGSQEFRKFSDLYVLVLDGLARIDLDLRRPYNKLVKRNIHSDFDFSRHLRKIIQVYLYLTADIHCNRI